MYHGHDDVFVEESVDVEDVESGSVTLHRIAA